MIRFTNEQLELLAAAYIFCYKNIGMCCEFDNVITYDFKTKYHINFYYRVSLKLYNLHSVVQKLYPIEHLTGYKKIYKIYQDIINNPTKLESSRLKLIDFIDEYSVDPDAYYDIFSLDGLNVMSADEYKKLHHHKFS